MTGLCKKYFGESLFSQCARRENFCKKCCNFNIGSNYAKKRKECKKACKVRLEGKEIKITKGKHDSLKEILKKKIERNPNLRKLLKKQLFGKNSTIIKRLLKKAKVVKS